jgi:hypothetical protein
VDYEPQAQVPYGTEQLLRTLPLAPAANNPLGQAANQAGAFVPLTPMEALQAARLARQAALATGRYVAPKAGQLAEQYMVNTGAILPLDVYHGTPHTLPPTPRNPLGEFDASKIGTGEGAQAYGYGTYVAENPAVAAGYRDKLQKVNYNGSEIDPSNPSHVALATVQQFGNKEKASAYLKQRANLMDYEINMQAAKLLDEKSALPTRNATGNLYKIDLPDEKIAKMLDFDKPLSQQKNILDSLTPEKMGLTLRPSVDGGYMAYLADGKPIGLQVKGVTPEVFREKWISRLREMGDLEGGAGRAVGYLGGTVPGDLPPLVAKALRQAGIPGIKYFDESSRSAGKGTRNFVVFPGEEKSMTILERNSKTR